MTRAFAPRPQSHSITEMTEYVLPQHTNAFGGVFGGQIMAWVDLCAAIASARHAGSACVTAYVDDLHFKGPVLVGEVVRLKARVTACFNTSLEVEVDVTGENPQSGRTWPCVHAFLTFVAMGSDRHPTAVPPLLLDTDEVRASQAAGEERRKARLGK
jgi:acyl-CoA hydrolase